MDDYFNEYGHEPLRVPRHDLPVGPIGPTDARIAYQFSEAFALMLHMLGGVAVVVMTAVLLATGGAPRIIPSLWAWFVPCAVVSLVVGVVAGWLNWPYFRAASLWPRVVVAGLASTVAWFLQLAIGLAIGWLLR